MIQATQFRLLMLALRLAKKFSKAAIAISRNGLVYIPFSYSISLCVQIGKTLDLLFHEAAAAPPSCAKS